MKNKNFNQEFIRITGELGAGLGLNRSIGQIYGLLYMSDAPLSLDTITTTLKMSKGSVSLNIRELEKWEAVKKIWVNGTRKDFYEANPDFINIIYRRTKGRMEKILNNFNSAIEGFEKKNSVSEIQKQRLSQIKEMQNLFRKIAEILPDNISMPKIKKIISTLTVLKSVLPKKERFF
jgi:DNA-binding transcriptional regulator GbsR (MarR family)